MTNFATGDGGRAISTRLGSALTVAVTCITLVGCTGAPPASDSIKRAESLTLYEGLPHQFYEPHLLESEKKSKSTVDLHGFPFYRETLALNAGDAVKLKKLLGASGTLQEFSAEKRCGGFHPDYALGWSTAGQDWLCLICFGCFEAIVHGPQGEIRYDLELDALNQLKSLLAPYRKNRPPLAVENFIGWNGSSGSTSGRRLGGESPGQLSRVLA